MKTIDALVMNPQMRRATWYVGPGITQKATRFRKRCGRARYETFVVTVGQPNWRERKFIKLAKRAGEPFPIKKIQLTPWPKAKEKRRGR